MKQTMRARRWWPEEVLDEIMPPGLDSPDRFICAAADAAGGEGWRLDYPAAVGADDGERGLFTRPLTVGDIVNFACCDDLGMARLRFWRLPPPDGAAFVALDPLPENFNWCRIAGDQDTLAENLDDLAAWLSDNEAYVDYFAAGAADTFVLDVEFARWSVPLPHKFEMTAAGPCFSTVSQAEARQ